MGNSVIMGVIDSTPALQGGNCIMGSPRHLVVRSTWGHLTTWWRDFCFIQLSLLGSQTCANIEYLLVYRWQNFTPRWSVSPLGGDFHLPVVRFSFLSLRMEEFAYILVAGDDPMIQSPPGRRLYHGGEVKFSPRHPVARFFYIKLDSETYANIECLLV